MTTTSHITKPPRTPGIFKIPGEPSCIQYIVYTDGDVEQDKKAVRRYATKIFPGEDIKVEAYEAKGAGLILLSNNEDEDGKKMVEDYAASYVHLAKENWRKKAEHKGQVIFMGIANCVLNAKNGKHFAYACFAEDRYSGFPDINYSWGYVLPDDDYKAAVSSGSINDYSFLQKYGIKRRIMISDGLLEKFAFYKNPKYKIDPAEPLTFSAPQVKYIVGTETEFLDDDRKAILKYAKEMSPGAAITLSVYVQTDEGPPEEFIRSKENKKNNILSSLVIYIHIQTYFSIVRDTASVYIHAIEQHAARSQHISCSKKYEIPLPNYTKNKAREGDKSFIKKHLKEHNMNREKLVLEALFNKFSNTDARDIE